MKNSLVKVNAVSVRNQNNVRRMHGTVDRILDMPGVMRVICGRCDEGALSMLEHTARRENELAGMDMAVGCIVSDKPLSEVEIARMVMERGTAQLIQKRMIGYRGNAPVIGNREMRFIEE